MRASLHPLTGSDLSFAFQLSRLAGWNQTPRDWERFLRLGEGGCFLAVEGEKPAGTVTTICYGNDLAWIGMVIVHPDFRRRGIGTGLLRRAIDHLRDDRCIACIRLDATPEGRPLYESLGFKAEWGLRRWRREAGAGSSETPPSPPTSLSDRALTLDRLVFGPDRSALLDSLRDESLTGAALADGSFGLVREGEQAYYLGPVTAATSSSGLSLVETLVGQCPHHRAIFWDLPDKNTSATQLATLLGFQPVRALTRMWLGDAPTPSDPMRIFGLADPGLG